MAGKSHLNAPALGQGLKRFAFESFGLQVTIATDAPEVFERIPALLPPGAQSRATGLAEASFAVLANGDGSYRVTHEGAQVSADIGLDSVVVLLAGSLPIHIAHHAPALTFVHAGVVAHEGVAIVLPGRTLDGKTTLVLELVRAGAIYYSDEYAVINEQGLVLPYAKPLSIRNGSQLQVDYQVQGFGGVVGTEPLPVGAVVFAPYQEGARWAPYKLSMGRAALGLLANTVAALKRSEEAIATIMRAIDGAVLLEGQRGEAAEAVGSILEAATTCLSPRANGEQSSPATEAP